MSIACMTESTPYDRAVLQMEHSKGPKPNPRRQAYIKRYKISQKRSQRVLTIKFMDQLDLCRSEAARRILLGVSK